MALYALISLAMFLSGVWAGVVVYQAIVEHFVRTEGNFTYKWGGRWYKVQGRRK